MKAFLMLLCVVSCSACEMNLIVAGQSNAVGWTPGWSLQNPNVLAWNPITNTYEQAIEPMQFFAGVSGMTAPWIRLGWILRDEGKYDQVKFVGSGAGGEAIAYWDEGQPGWEALRENLIASEKASKIRAFIWYQGESDYSAYVGYYRTKLANLISRVRALTRAKLPVIIVKPTNLHSANIFASLHTEIYAVADADFFVTVIDNFGFETLNSETSHITYQTQNLLAKRIATTLILMDQK